MSIDESRIESVQSGAEESAGVRVISGGTTYFAHVDGLDPADLERAADEAAAALRGERVEPQPLRAVGDRPAPGSSNGPKMFPPRARPSCCASSTSAGAAPAARSRSWLASYAEARREVAVANSEGLLSGDDRTRTRLAAQAVARREDRVETGAETLGAQRGSSYSMTSPAKVAAQRRRQGRTLLDAPPGSDRVDAGRRRRRFRRRPIP